MSKDALVFLYLAGFHALVWGALIVGQCVEWANPEKDTERSEIDIGMKVLLAAIAPTLLALFWPIIVPVCAWDYWNNRHYRKGSQ